MVDKEWTFEKRISIPHILTLVVVFVSAIGAYFHHDSRLALLEDRQKTLVAQVEEQRRETRKLDVLEAKLESMNRNIYDMRKVIDKLYDKMEETH